MVRDGCCQVEKRNRKKVDGVHKVKSGGGSSSMAPPTKRPKVGGASSAASAPLNIRNKTRPWLASNLDDLSDSDEDEDDKA
jgi:hypothetical protein